MRSKIIKAGWESYLKNVIPKKASIVQITECERAFYGGAAVLFHSIMAIIDDDREPTKDDLRRMDDILHELNMYGQHLDKYMFGDMEH